MMEEVEIKAVLHEKFYEDVKFFIEDKQKTTDIIKELTQKYPLTNFSHLKRIKTVNQELHVLIKEQQEDSNEDISVLPIEGIKKFYTAKIPRTKPLTRQQFVKAQRHWSCNFHEDKHIEKCLAGKLFSYEELAKHKSYIQLASKEMEKIGEQGGSGAVMVDPLTDTVLAKAHTSTDHLLQHAVMKCIDLIAELQGGGAWSRKKDVAMPQNKPGIPVTLADNDEFCSTKRQKIESSAGYLCSKYDLYTTVEPCIMCSMALVHSRINRVFYASSDPLAGGLGSVYKIHCHPSINHHFEVFRFDYS